MTGLVTALLRRRAAEATAGLPALLATARVAARSVEAGAHARRRAGPGEDFWQFRDYHPGNRPQDISWRQSAKGDRHLVRQNEWQTAQTALFWCAGGPGMAWRSRDDLPTKREAALILCLGLGTLLADGGEQIGPLDGSRRPARHELAIDMLAEILSASNDTDIPFSITSNRHTQNVLASDFLMDPASLQPALSRLAGGAGGGILLHVLDPAELDLPYEGRALFTAPDNQMHVPVAQVAALRAAYSEKIEAHCLGLAALVRRCGWHYILHRTDRPTRETLATLSDTLRTTAGPA